MTLLGGESGGAPDRTLERPALALAAAATGLSLLVLAVWFVDAAAMARSTPGEATMKVNTAVAAIALAVSLLTARAPVVAILAAVVAAVGLASLTEHLLGVDLGIGESLVADVTVGDPELAGRMAPASAVCLVALAAGRWALLRTAHRGAELLAALALAVSALAVLGYLFQVEQLYSLGAHPGMALPTAVVVGLLALALGASVPGGVLPWVTRDQGAGATLVRHMVPVALLVVPVLGIVPLVGLYTDVIGARFSIGLMVAAAAVVLLVITGVAARRLHRIDRQRLAAQDRLHELNDQLRERRDLEWRRAEALSRDLGEERARFQRAISKIDDLIWSVEVMPDGELRPEFVSGDASGLFGGEKPEADVRARAIPNLVHPDDEPLLAAFDDAIRAGAHAEAELRIVGYDGVVRWAWVRATPRREGRQLFADGISTNISERRALAEKREHLLALEQEQVRKLKQLNHLREELLAVTGHELRTPLAVVLGHAELLLQDTDLTEGQRRQLEVVARRARQVALLVEDIFDLAKFSAGLASIDVRSVDLHDAVADAVEEHRSAADAAGLTLGLQALPVTVSADPVRLRQVLDNLLSNAIKYSLPGGHVSVTTRCEGDAATISVTDGGIGIPEAELDHVFDRMFRASSATDRDIKGTGLGLAVAKALVEAHDGTISVATRPEGGTEFTVAIPVQRPHVRV